MQFVARGKNRVLAEEKAERRRPRIDGIDHGLCGARGVARLRAMSLVGPL